MSDLFAPLEPLPEDVARPVGTIRGDVEGLGAGLEVWCGPPIGWRSFGDVVMGGGQATVVRVRQPGQERPRLLVGITFDLGEAPPIRRQAEDDETDA